jgi:hypothetical protein
MKDAVVVVGEEETIIHILNNAKVIIFCWYQNNEYYSMPEKMTKTNDTGPNPTVEKMMIPPNRVSTSSRGVIDNNQQLPILMTKKRMI